MKKMEKKSLAGKIALDMIVFVALAVAMGVAAGVALAGLTLVFASQASAAEAPRQSMLLLRPRDGGRLRYVVSAYAIDEHKDRGGERADRTSHLL